MVDVFRYVDYRRFLADILEEKERADKRFSQRAIVRRMGVSSYGYFDDVISGRRGLAIERAAALCGILGLNGSQTAYFRNMLRFDAAKSGKGKNEIFKQLLAAKKRELRYLDNEQLSLFSDWFLVPIRELLRYYDFTDDFAALARIIFPPIGVREAKKAILTLESLGLIRKDASGIYRPIDAAVSTGDEVYSFFVTRFQFTMTDLAKVAIEKIAPADRDISGLTLAISRDTFSSIKEEIRKFRKRLLHIAADDPSPERVIRCNFQMFPLTKPAEPEKPVPRRCSGTKAGSQRPAKS